MEIKMDDTNSLLDFKSHRYRNLNSDGLESESSTIRFGQSDESIDSLKGEYTLQLVGSC